MYIVGVEPKAYQYAACYVAGLNKKVNYDGLFRSQSCADDHLFQLNDKSDCMQLCHKTNTLCDSCIGFSSNEVEKSAICLVMLSWDLCMLEIHRKIMCIIVMMTE